MDALALENTLLGVDVIRNQRLVAKDVGEIQLMNLLGEPVNVATNGKLVGPRSWLRRSGAKDIYSDAAINSSVRR